ncbi:hypothetical protein BDK51DRAFT_43613 [Blyttiomyces helicus]|uniref:F-box domain-containing protein n=1 Tax=Blyttiomyces helicus TaxID=388810 RepID=A0A4P9WMD8_9FUNG|nr:hypothetical protein BDK51DRAFT_43613 [Blyttiomyces helicus]|eukprot:RKO92838.1 hypothetical protein BDK51DRAFT_43613 [Blyttiomyces helicus]
MPFEKNPSPPQLQTTVGVSYWLDSREEHVETEGQCHLVREPRATGHTRRESKRQHRLPNRCRNFYLRSPFTSAEASSAAPPRPILYHLRIPAPLVVRFSSSHHSLSSHLSPRNENGLDAFPVSGIAAQAHLKHRLSPASSERRPLHSMSRRVPKDFSEPRPLVWGHIILMRAWSSSAPIASPTAAKLEGQRDRGPAAGASMRQRRDNCELFIFLADEQHLFRKGGWLGRRRASEGNGRSNAAMKIEVENTDVKRRTRDSVRKHIQGASCVGGFVEASQLLPNHWCGHKVRRIASSDHLRRACQHWHFNGILLELVFAFRGPMLVAIWKEGEREYGGLRVADGDSRDSRSGPGARALGASTRLVNDVPGVMQQKLLHALEVLQIHSFAVRPYTARNRRRREGGGEMGVYGVNWVGGGAADPTLPPPAVNLHVIKGAEVAWLDWPPHCEVRGMPPHGLIFRSEIEERIVLQLGNEPRPYLATEPLPIENAAEAFFQHPNVQPPNERQRHLPHPPTPGPTSKTSASVSLSIKIYSLNNRITTSSMSVAHVIGLLTAEAVITHPPAPLDSTIRMNPSPTTHSPRHTLHTSSLHPTGKSLTRASTPHAGQNAGLSQRRARVAMPHAAPCADEVAGGFEDAVAERPLGYGGERCEGGEGVWRQGAAVTCVAVERSETARIVVNVNMVGPRRGWGEKGSIGTKFGAPISRGQSSWKEADVILVFFAIKSSHPFVRLRRLILMIPRAPRRLERAGSTFADGHRSGKLDAQSAVALRAWCYRRPLPGWSESMDEDRWATGKIEEKRRPNLTFLKPTTPPPHGLINTGAKTLPPGQFRKKASKPARRDLSGFSLLCLLLALSKPLVRLPPELLQQILRNTQAKGCYDRPPVVDIPPKTAVLGLYSDLVSASLVSRHWHALATHLIWDHVVIHTPDVLLQFMAYCRASPRGAELAAMVRVFDVRILDEDVWGNVLAAQVAEFARRLRGVRALLVQNSDKIIEAALDVPPVAVVASLLSTCPELAVLDIAAPRRDRSDFDRNAVSRRAARLRCLRITGCGEATDMKFCALLIRSVG